MNEWWGKNEIFRENPEPAQIFPPQISGTDLELSNSHISITDLEL
jgi:hypothetical protein